MNLLGEQVTVVRASDPTKNGLKGKVVLETANTVLMSSEERRFAVEKKGTMFLLACSGIMVSGEDIAGRLEDRLRSKRR
jgi:RNase P/RNase MRP subunit p29